MGELAVAVRDVGKRYRIYSQPQDRLKQMVFGRFGRHYGEDFWALRHVTFDVAPGERFGVIGRNGSGKSTLLQMIAGTIAPTEGEVDIRGRVAALLELGSGFNPEFTGRENVFLNAAIQGLSREQVLARFDDIAAFADIGEFIDQSVKVYSSGMFVRLAFAVSTSMEADVLLIDEALAVGDVFFRQKCYRRLESSRATGGCSKSGRATASHSRRYSGRPRSGSAVVRSTSANN
ncbi:MAG: ABC transporter ATP-binding protein [Acidimicrobiia bacterium]|nr:ABC transporter ATP-binding protein [Acidimicrobiia bacterium]